MQVIIVFLIEFIIFLSLWLIDDYIGTMLSATFVAISLFILLIALMAELLDRSKVPRLYFWLMAVSVIAPLVASAVYIGLFGVELDWMRF